MIVLDLSEKRPQNYSEKLRVRRIISKTGVNLAIPHVLSRKTPNSPRKPIGMRGVFARGSKLQKRAGLSLR